MLRPATLQTETKFTVHQSKSFSPGRHLLPHGVDIPHRSRPPSQNLVLLAFLGAGLGLFGLTDTSHLGRAMRRVLAGKRVWLGGSWPTR